MLQSHKNTIFETLGRNPIHPFPARMASGVALEALEGNAPPIRVLDPMAGSGTVLAIARANGHSAIGIDSDPLAVLLATVWTRNIDPTLVNSRAETVLKRSKEIFGSLPSGKAYPEHSDEETRKFLRYWFDDYSRRQLAALSLAIVEVDDEITRDVLWCGFSRLIIVKSAGASLAMDLSHSRPHKKFTRAPVKPFNRFLSSVEMVVSNCPNIASLSSGPPAVVRRGDARKLDIQSGSIDLVLTSPPYLNAIDYMRCSKFSLVWMGYTVSGLREIRAGIVGTEVSSKQASEAEWVAQLIEQLELKPALSGRGYGMLAQYVWDMGRSLKEVSRVLRNGGRAVYVVGDSTVRGTYIQNSSIVAAVACEHGLTLRSRQSRDLPANRRYMPPPKGRGSNATMDGRMRKEVVLVFDKLQTHSAF
jgi:hypothetical protein